MSEGNRELVAGQAVSQADLERAALAHTAPPSMWPIFTAGAVALALIGIMVHPVVVALGALLTVGCIVGWGVEGVRVSEHS